eukprot:gene23084-30277_t
MGRQTADPTTGQGVNESNLPRWRTRLTRQVAAAGGARAPVPRGRLHGVGAAPAGGGGSGIPRGRLLAAQSRFSKQPHRLCSLSSTVKQTGSYPRALAFPASNRQRVQYFGSDDPVSVSTYVSRTKTIVRSASGLVRRPGGPPVNRPRSSPRVLGREPQRTSSLGLLR